MSSQWAIIIVPCIATQLSLIFVRAENSFPYVDYSVNPCDDFYRFACGNFENVHPVPPTYKTWDGFTRLQKKIDEQLKELLEGVKSRRDSKSLTKARKMYAGCMNTSLRDRKGIFPIRNILKGWPTKYNDWNSASKITASDWQKMANLVADYGVQFIFKLTIRADVLNATRTSVYIESDDLALPTALLQRSVHILEHDFPSRMDSEFTIYLRKIMTLLRNYGRGNIDDREILTRARSINEFMMTLTDAAALDFGEETTTATMIPSVGSISLVKLQAWSDRVLINFSDTINWGSYIKAAFKRSGVGIDNETQIFITNRSLLRNLLLFVHETGKYLFDDFVYSRLATYMTPDLSSDFYNIAMDFYTLRGYVPSVYPRWKYCLHKVLDFPKIGLSFAVAQKYRGIHISEDTVERARMMVENLRDALEELIDEAEWMDESTRDYAVHKLRSILVLTGSPDYLKTEVEVDRYYKNLRIYRNDHFGNVNRMRSFSQEKNFADLAAPRDRNLWTQSPLIVNAYYNGINNRILFPISTMIEPLFSGKATRYLRPTERVMFNTQKRGQKYYQSWPRFWESIFFANTRVKSFLDYARIGSIMAHELTHAFDSQGKLLDAEGSMVSWWSQSTEEIYASKTKCFVEQYSKYVTEGSNITVNGGYTLPENIADNVGLRAAYRAFKNLREKRRLMYSDSYYFTTDQEFYLAFASTWCHVGPLLSNDKHAPHKYRVLGSIRNMKNYLEAWRCTEVDRDECILW